MTGPTVALIVLLAAAGALAAGDPAGDPEAGEELYVTGCSTCHGLDGEGTDDGPSLRDAGPASTDFYLSTGRMPLDDPESEARRKPPAYDEGEIADLVAYVDMLGDGPEIPDVDPAAGDLSAGNLLYGANCAACHHSAGSGGAVGRSVIAPALDRATPLQVAEAVRVGPGAMPRFGEGVIGNRELNDLLRYVEYLDDPEDRGGAPLARVGPVPEGLVAWIVGLGSLLAACMWIGTRERHP